MGAAIIKSSKISIALPKNNRFIGQVWTNIAQSTNCLSSTQRMPFNQYGIYICLSIISLAIQMFQIKSNGIE